MQTTFEERKEKSVEPPAFDVVQVTSGQDGRAFFQTVGGLWKPRSPDSKAAFTLWIGKARFVVFPHKEREVLP